MNRRAGIVLTALVLSAFVAGACARGTRQPPPPVGQTLLILPVAVNQAPAAPPRGESINVLLALSWKGKPLPAGSDAEILFFGANSPLPVYSARWEDLQNAHRTSGCSSEALAELDGSISGEVLFCDGRIDPGAIRTIDAIVAGERRSLTSWGSAPVKPGMVSLQLTFP